MILLSIISEDVMQIQEKLKRALRPFANVNFNNVKSFIVMTQESG